MGSVAQTEPHAAGDAGLRSNAAKHLPVVMDPERIPEELRDSWDRIRASGIEARMRRALYRIAIGEGYREAAEAEGYGDHAQVWRSARRFGLAAAKKSQILDRHRRVALLGACELERRLIDEPDAISTRDLTILTGVATDKVSVADGWAKSRSDGGERIGDLADLARAIVAAGGTLELKVYEPPDRAAGSTQAPGDRETIVDLVASSGNGGA